jgi:hypothetical protein
MKLTNAAVASVYADRILGLRHRLAKEADPVRRRKIETAISSERWELALLLGTGGSGKESFPPSFRLARDRHGTLALRFSTLGLPVSPAYLEHLVADRGMRLNQGAGRVVSAAWAVDALQEAHDSVRQLIASFEDHRSRIDLFLRIAQALAGESPSDARDVG